MAATGRRYVAVPFEAQDVNIFGTTQELIRLEKEWQPLDVSRYNHFTTHSGFTVKWAEIPVEDLETLDTYINWSFNSSISGHISFSGTGKQAITFFRSLKTRWLLELVPEDVFLVNL